MDIEESVAFKRDRLEVATICSSDYYQHYIPTFCYTVGKAYPEAKISVGVTGEVDQLTLDALSVMGNFKIVEKPGTNEDWDSDCVITKNVLPEGVSVLESTVNTMRFLYFKNELDMQLCDIDATIITDVDFMWFRGGIDLFRWHVERMREIGSCYAGHHGPWKKPRRFPEGWRGDKERVAGGFFMVTPEWFRKTREARAKYTKLLKEGKIGTYREEDEVVLCKILKESGLPVVQDKSMPTDLRGIHFGDFKFDDRWTNLMKMQTKLTDSNIYKYIEMASMDTKFRKIRDIVCRDEQIALMFKNLHLHCQQKGFGGYE